MIPTSSCSLHPPARSCFPPWSANSSGPSLKRRSHARSTTCSSSGSSCKGAAAAAAAYLQAAAAQRRREQAGRQPERMAWKCYRRIGGS